MQRECPTWAEIAGYRVLLAADNPIGREIALESLHEFGCEVVSVSNGAEAVELHRQQEFDLILMDWHVAEIDFYRATALIRSAERQANPSRTTPIIALTANTFFEERKRCIEMGMDDHLVKPFDQVTLGAILKRWLPKSDLGADRAANYVR